MADSEGSETKKRKLDSDESVNGVTSGVSATNDTRNARYPNLMHANKHIVKVHELMKRECEQLAELIVRGYELSQHWCLYSLSGQSEAMGELVYAEVCQLL